MRWTVHIEGGPMRVNHAAVCIGDKIYSFGGYCSSEEYKDWEPIPVHVLDTTTLRWAPVNYKKNNLVPFQRYGHTTVAYGHRVFMWGGRNNSVASETLSCFDTKTLEWSTPPVSGMVPYAKDGHSACIIKNKMYIFGGFEYSSDQYSQEVHCLDLDTLKWTFIDTRGSPPSYRDFHTAVAYGDRMYVFGGRGGGDFSPYNNLDEEYCPKVYYLDTVEQKWVVTNPTGTWPEGRRSHSAWLHNDFMYIFGGFNGDTKTHFNDLYRYSIKENYWEHINVGGFVPCKRRRQASLIYKDKVYLFGGTSPCPHTSNRPIVDDTDNPERLIDNSDLHLLDYSPTLKTLSILCVLEHQLDQSSLPRDIILDIQMMTLPNRISRPNNQAG
ncbi:kelch domain-containing protein 3 [Galleria mellonella]|uniref:Kelch domain-containing protein 3 n=1 Tax=Galleria mellonella TaxID=7137 RepID=A0A6J1WE02_GALME|nr:kelch domain-containing protein 3 [Galleria mellonella]XP_052756097.1 kelch domain-containing protein 3 [Galleria mellonella]